MGAQLRVHTENHSSICTPDLNVGREYKKKEEKIMKGYRRCDEERPGLLQLAEKII